MKRHVYSMMALLVSVLACQTGWAVSEAEGEESVLSADWAEDRLALTLKASTLGVGAEGAIKLHNNWNSRIGFNVFEYDYEGTTGDNDVEYDVELSLFTVSALVDWFPFGGGFRVSSGLFLNNNSVDLNTRNGEHVFSGRTYNASPINGDVDFNSIAPYVGLGWGNPFGKDSNWSFSLDLGVMFQGSPDLSVRPPANIAIITDAPLPTPIRVGGELVQGANQEVINQHNRFLDDFQREVDDLEDDIEGYEFYPVLSIGLSYRFW